jgi:hypothetical protein
VELKLERKDQPDDTQYVGPIALWPNVTDDYWEYRVRLSDRQAIVGFPKFGTIGIGFAVEEDWNTNLPYTTPAERIYAHIKHNKGDDAISDEDCIAAIELIREAARGTNPYGEALRAAEQVAGETWGDKVYSLRPATDGLDPHQQFIVRLFASDGPVHFIRDGVVEGNS